MCVLLQMWTCQFCCKQYSTRHNFVFHIKGVHGVGGGVQCKTCGKKDFGNETTFRKHRKQCMGDVAKLKMTFS